MFRFRSQSLTASGLGPVLRDRREKRMILLILLSAALLRLAIAPLYVSRIDLMTHNVPWAVYGAQDRFGMYSNPAMAEFGLDYPPIFPFLLSLFGRPLLWAHDAPCRWVEMLLVKFFPVLADLVLIFCVWLVAADYKVRSPWKVALLWSLNPATIFNCAFWGQSDSFLLLFLLIMIWALDRRLPECATLAFALGCLTKLQMCYFAPLLLLGFLMQRYKPLRWLRSLALGGAVGLLVWYPFMRRGEWLALPLRIYFGGYQKYDFINAYAANLFAFGDHYMQSDSDIWFFNISYAAFSTCAVVAAILWLCWCALRVLRRRPVPPLCLCALVYFEILFLFTTRQHERYQLPVLVLALFWWFLSRSKISVFFTVAFSIITFLNQFYVLVADNQKFLADFCAMLEMPVAAINLLLFPFLCAAAMRSCSRTELQPVEISG